MTNKCTVEGCNNRVLSRGYCAKHYMQIRRHGFITHLERGEKLCLVNNCNNKHTAKGYCNKHYRQIKLHGRLTPEKEHGTVHICTIDGCYKIVHAKGYCNKHYEDYRKALIKKSS